MIPPQTAQDGASSLVVPAGPPSGPNVSSGRVSKRTVWTAGYAAPAAGAP
jgi:hypothetical protein